MHDYIAERDAARARCKEYADAILVGLSGLVCTPVEGYEKAGGPGAALSSLREMRTLVAITPRLLEAAEAYAECQDPFATYDRLKTLRGAIAAARKELGQ